MNSNPILKIDSITKQFPGVKALDGISFEIHEGEVLALLGENGAGKSTLIKIIAGVQPATSGTMIFQGREVHFKSPTEAKEAGISIVYQELANVPLLSVAENLFINEYGKKSRILSCKKMNEQARRIVQEAGMHIDVTRPMGECNVAEKQQIEIARALYENAKLLILDEPTSALNREEIAHLLETIRQLKSRGIAVILITHKMDEIFPVADSVVVLRDGVSVAQKRIEETSENELITLMVGREIRNMYPDKGDPSSAEIILKAEHLKNAYIRDVSFELRRGEVMGIYGLMGSGHQELGQTLFGIIPDTEGSLYIDGQPVDFSSPKKCVQAGLSYLPAERKSEGLVQIQTVAVNLMAASYERTGSPKLISRDQEQKAARRWMKELAIKANSPDTVVETLSGGNQQKVIIAKWLEIGPKIIILNEPTRGIDVGSKTEIYKLIRQMCREGVSVIMITSEMPELIGMADRAIVLHEGQLQETLSADELTENRIMTAAIGGLGNA